MIGHMTLFHARVFRLVAVLQFVFLLVVSSVVAEDGPKMARPFLQRKSVRKKVTATPAPAKKQTPAPTVEPTPEPTLAPLAEPTPEPTVAPKRSAKPAATQPSRAARSAPASSGGAVDLSTLSTDSSSGSSARGASVSRVQKTPHSTNSGVFPNFKFYFDFMLKYAPGMDSNSAFGFDSFHQVMLVEMNVTPELLFMTEIRSEPRFFELDYQASPKVTWRWGKIWIPFDDMAPHNIFGGRINTSKLWENSTDSPFLPDLWAELGIGMKYMMNDTVNASTELHLYVTNGIGSGGTDPTASGTAYPQFQSTGISGDNNNDKTFGARIAGKFFQRFGIGASVYRGVWTERGTPNKNLTLIGLDSQLRPTNSAELRMGLMMGTIELNPPSAKDSYSKGGAYMEAGYKFGENQNWKFLARGGVVQNDSRVQDNSDRKVVGATLLKRMGPVEASLQYSRDLQRFAGKDFYNFAAFRLVTAF